MPERLNPETLYNSVQYGFSHAAISEEGKTIHCAGQVAWDKDCQLVGGDDVALQTRQCLKNLDAVLEAAGATRADIVRIRTYVVDHTVEKLGQMGPEFAAFWGDITPSPNTWLGVQALALPGFLVEIEATAVIKPGS